MPNAQCTMCIAHSVQRQDVRGTQYIQRGAILCQTATEWQNDKDENNVFEMR